MRTVAGPGDRGRLAENAVANALDARGHPLHYRKDGGHEVDFVVPGDDGRVHAIPVSCGDEVPAREEAALTALREALPKNRRGTFLLLTRAGQEDSTPLWQWLLHPAP